MKGARWSQFGCLNSATTHLLFASVRTRIETRRPFCQTNASVPLVAVALLSFQCAMHLYEHTDTQTTTITFGRTLCCRPASLLFYQEQAPSLSEVQASPGSRFSVLRAGRDSSSYNYASAKLVSTVRCDFSHLNCVSTQFAGFRQSLRGQICCFAANDKGRIRYRQADPVPTGLRESVFMFF